MDVIVALEAASGLLRIKSLVSQCAVAVVHCYNAAQADRRGSCPMSDSVPLRGQRDPSAREDLHLRPEERPRVVRMQMAIQRRQLELESTSTKAPEAGRDAPASASSWPPRRSERLRESRARKRSNSDWPRSEKRMRCRSVSSDAADRTRDKIQEQREKASAWCHDRRVTRSERVRTSDRRREAPGRDGWWVGY